MRQITQTIAPEICVILAIFGVTMLPFGNFWLFIVTYALILLFFKLNKRRRDAAAHARVARLTGTFTQQNRTMHEPEK